MGEIQEIRILAHEDGRVQYMLKLQDDSKFQEVLSLLTKRIGPGFIHALLFTQGGEEK